MKKIIFYNHYQNGDVALCRGIVDFIVTNCKSDVEFYFLMFKQNNLQFNDKVKVIQSTHLMGKWDYNRYKVNEGIFVGEDYITINLWIGSSPSFMNRNDVIKNGPYPMDYNSKWIFEHCKEVISFLKKNTDIDIDYPKSEMDILPTACKNPPQKTAVDNFLDSVKKFKKKVLVCNNNVESSQSPNFDLRDTILPLVSNFDDICFIYTNGDNVFFDNEFCVNNYCNTPNLIEIDYLSTKCDILISRRSGPGEVIQTYENFYDANKSFIFLTNWDVLTAIYEQGNCKIYHSNDYSSVTIQNLIKTCLI